MSNQITAVLQVHSFDPQLVAEIQQIGRLRKASAGKVLMSPENPGNEVPMVKSGVLKVVRQEPNGKEVFLYFLEGGET